MSGSTINPFKDHIMSVESLRSKYSCHFRTVKKQNAQFCRQIVQEVDQTLKNIRSFPFEAACILSTVVLLKISLTSLYQRSTLQTLQTSTNSKFEWHLMYRRKATKCVELRCTQITCNCGEYCNRPTSELVAYESRCYLFLAFCSSSVLQILSRDISLCTSAVTI